jgi:hypothetical protein
MKAHNVFVIGAGASCCYGFPTGGELLQMLQDPRFEVGWSVDPDEIEKAAQFSSNLRKFQIGPVDRYIGQILSSQCCGSDSTVDMWSKMTAQIILECEGRFAANDFHYRDHGDHWMVMFHEFLREVHGASFRSSAMFASAISDGNTFITFNYDRLLEYYFASLIMSSFLLKFDEALGEMRGVRVHHVHGICGSFFPGDKYVRFGDRLLSANVKSGKNPPRRKLFEDAAREIKATQSVNGDEVKSYFMDRVFNSSEEIVNIVFLGFGFDRDNLRKIGVDEAFADRILKVEAGREKDIRFFYTNKNAGPSNPFDYIAGCNKVKSDMIWDRLRSKIKSFGSIGDLLRDRTLRGLE